MEWEIVKLLISVLWVPIVGLMMAKRAEERKDKESLQKEVQELKTSLAVLEKTSVTEVTLRDYIAKRFQESDMAQRRELERLENKIDNLANSINDIVKHLPKRKGEGE